MRTFFTALFLTLSVATFAQSKLSLSLRNQTMYSHYLGQPDYGILASASNYWNSELATDFGLGLNYQASDYVTLRSNFSFIRARKFSDQFFASTNAFTDLPLVLRYDVLYSEARATVRADVYFTKGRIRPYSMLEIGGGYMLSSRITGSEQEAVAVDRTQLRIAGGGGVEFKITKRLSLNLEAGVALTKGDGNFVFGLNSNAVNVSAGIRYRFGEGLRFFKKKKKDEDRLLPADTE